MAGTDKLQSTTTAAVAELSWPISTPRVAQVRLTMDSRDHITTTTVPEMRLRSLSIDLHQAGAQSPQISMTLPLGLKATSLSKPTSLLLRHRLPGTLWRGGLPGAPAMAKRGPRAASALQHQTLRVQQYVWRWISTKEVLVLCEVWRILPARV